MNDVVKGGITLMAALTAMALIGVACYGFLHEAKMWGGMLLAGMATGFLTMCAAYNA